MFFLFWSITCVMSCRRLSCHCPFIFFILNILFYELLIYIQIHLFSSLVLGWLICVVTKYKSSATHYFYPRKFRQLLFSTTELTWQLKNKSWFKGAPRNWTCDLYVNTQALHPLICWTQFYCLLPSNLVLSGHYVSYIIHFVLLSVFLKISILWLLFNLRILLVIEESMFLKCVCVCMCVVLLQASSFYQVQKNINIIIQTQLSILL